MRWVPSWKILPTYKSLHWAYKEFFQGPLLRYAGVKSPFLAQTFELAAFRHLEQFVVARGEQWVQGVLFNLRIRYALDPSNKIFSGLDLDFFERRIGPPLWPPTQQWAQPSDEWTFRSGFRRIWQTKNLRHWELG